MSASTSNEKREIQAPLAPQGQTPAEPSLEATPYNDHPSLEATASNAHPTLKVAVPKMSDFGGDDDDVGG